VDALAAGLVDGRCGITPLRLFRHRGRANVAAEVPEDVAGFEVALDAPATRRLSRADRFALAAAEEACHDAGLDASLRGAAALYAGATTAGMARRRRRTAGSGPARTAAFACRACSRRRSRRRRPSWRRRSASSARVAPSRRPARRARSRSRRAPEAIARGRARVVLAIGSDQLCRLTYAGFDGLQALDPEPCRPFDRDRRGLSLGEGAAALVLEGRGPRARPGRPRARAGRGDTGRRRDAHHVTAPHPEGAGAGGRSRPRSAAPASPRAGGRLRERARQRHAPQRRGRGRRPPARCSAIGFRTCP
jgi:3-oxoacyl-[acyl-carrier-protein] synthase II